MSNMWLPQAFQRFPSAVQGFPESLRRANPRARLFLSVAAIVLAIGAVWYAVSALSTPPAAHVSLPPVLVAQAQTKNISVMEHTIGTVVANATVQLTARVQGQLLRANFQEGQIVHAGDLLFEIDPRPYQAAYNSAMASLVTAKAKADRYAQLLGLKAIAPQDADDAKAAYLVAKAAVDTARLNLDYTRISSPIDGKTGPILIQPGNQITASAGDSGSAAAATSGANTLVVITQVQPVKVSFFLPQVDLPRIQNRAKAGLLTAMVEIHGSVTNRLTAPVDFVSNAVSASTGTIELRATFDNKDLLLVPGQLVDVAVSLDNLQNAVVVPRQAVNVGPNGRYVYVVTPDGKAQMRPVTVLYDDGTTSDAVQGDVKPAERVITDGQLRVIPGHDVAVVQPGVSRRGNIHAPQ
jgi:membrane fusion protein, multidrug efflux system